VGIILNVVLLSTFKYLPETSASIPFSSLQRFSHIAMPIGLSFWTFQAMSYLFDLYRDEELDPSYVEFALYMVFFPVTISGPVCRMPDMLPQFRSEETTKWSDIWLGFRRIAIGILMLQIAKLLGQGILAGDGIASGFDRATHLTGIDVWCLAFGYGLQLFFDFAGYSHVAIGAARALGIATPENFARPFASTTPSIFWTRWHMSLSFWIRDYVFLPLAVLRREVWWRNLMLIISMVLFGLWHKATLLFLFWGLYHGILLVLHRQMQQLKIKLNWDPSSHLWAAISWITTISLISLGWIFFRAQTWSKATTMLSEVASPLSYGRHFLSGSLYVLIFGVAFGYAIVLLTKDALDRYSSELSVDSGTIPSASVPLMFIARWRWYWIPPLYILTLLFVSIATLSSGTTAAQMMYGNF